MAECQPNAEITRSSIWFSDGNIVLQAESTQFCVYGGYLAQQSIVFRDMFSLPQDGSSMETVEGKPVVRVAMDTAEDMSHLLSALYDAGGNLIHTHLNRDNYEMLCAVLRLSTKYMIPRLREGVSKVFTNAYPSRLPRWDAEIHRLYVECNGYDSDTDCWSNSSPHEVRSWDFSVLNACTEANLLSPLPTAYYRCSTLTAQSIYKSPLSAQNKWTLILGKEALRRRFVGGRDDDDIPLIFQEFDRSHGDCLKAVQACQNEWIADALDCECHPLAKTFITETRGYAGGEVPCKSCCASLSQEWTMSRKEIFRSLPEFFNLEGWDVLAEKDKAVQESFANS